jgi:hypothetical protein
VESEFSAERQLLETAIAKLRASVMALVFGMVGGSSLFVGTLWLVVRGGKDVGRHLNLLNNYFPGYSVSWVGSLVGFAYGAVLGAVLGWSIAWLYNRFSERSGPSR